MGQWMKEMYNYSQYLGMDHRYVLLNKILDDVDDAHYKYLKQAKFFGMNRLFKSSQAF